MFLTIQTLFDDANIVSAIIRRVNQTRKDTISYFPQSDYSCVQGLYRFCNRSYGRLYQFTFWRETHP